MLREKSTALACVLAGALAACAGTLDVQDYYSQQSAGKVGCRKREIVIRDFTNDGNGNREWTARCRGVDFYCAKESPTMAGYTVVDNAPTSCARSDAEPSGAK